MTKKIYLETLKSVLGRSILHYSESPQRRTSVRYCTVGKKFDTIPVHYIQRNKGTKRYKYALKQH